MYLNCLGASSAGSFEQKTQDPGVFHYILTLLRLKKASGSPDNRKVEATADYPSNYISTSKYTIWNFIPKNLFEQFRRAANVYFLFLAVLQLIPYFNVGNPLLTVGPITSVLFATAIKDGFEDYRRHKQDRDMNLSATVCLQNWANTNSSDQENKVKKRAGWWPFSNGSHALNSSRDSLLDAEKDAGVVRSPLDKPLPPPPPDFLECHWQDLMVGDVVLLKSDDPIPADLVVLSTSSQDGEFYVETKNLDGETNLKPRKCLSSTMWLTDETDAASIRAWIEVEPPSSNLYQLNGTLHLHPEDLMEVREGSEIEVASKPHAQVELIQPSEDYEPFRIDISNTLLRGCMLRNTDWIIGIVVYTGSDTKIMLNSGGTPSKQSRIEKQMNKHVIINFIILFVLCLACAIANGNYHSGWSAGSGRDLFAGSGDDTASGEAAFLTFW